MSKSKQSLYAARDFIYTLALAIFGWVLADFSGLIAHPVDALNSFFANFWNVLFLSLVVFAYGIEILFCPGFIRPRDEEPVPWRRWKGMLMEANLTPAFFCARLGVMQITRDDAVRYVGIFFFVVSMIVTILYGIKRSQKIRECGDKSYCTTGIYRKVRYPEYLAQLTYSLFVAFLFRSWPSLIASILLLRWQNSYYGKLDKYMDEKYGKEWINYRVGTKKIIPYLI
jgi:protein-S-isoprenylcysteine O-methyltransferase Ste14